jgi:hypothetical protein
MLNKFEETWFCGGEIKGDTGYSLESGVESLLMSVKSLPSKLAGRIAPSRFAR